LTSAKGSGVSLKNLSYWSQETNIRSITLDYKHATGEHCCRITYLERSNFMIAFAL